MQKNIRKKVSVETFHPKCFASHCKGHKEGLTLKDKRNITYEQEFKLLGFGQLFKNALLNELALNCMHWHTHKH